jgi:hypothetical protein
LRRKLFVLNVILVALIAGAAFRLREQWLAGKAREQKMFRQPLGPVTPPQAAPFQPPQPLTASAYSDIAQKMLFAKDRDPTVVVETGPSKPLPPLPVAHGVVNLGEGPLVILSETSDSPHRALAPGQKVGEFTLVAVNRDEIVLEWEGQQFKKRLEELAERTKRPDRTPAVAGVPAQPAPVAVVQTTKVEPAASLAGPGRDTGVGIRLCQQGDPSPPGTIKDGFRKVVTRTPFGGACRWEPVR